MFQKDYYDKLLERLPLICISFNKNGVGGYKSVINV